MKKKFLLAPLLLQPILLFGALEPVALQQMNQLYATAELNFQSGKIKESRELLKKLQALPGYSELNEQDRTEISLRLAEDHFLLDENKELQPLLENLLSQQLPNESLVRAILLKAELSKKEGKAEEAFFLLTQLDKKVPQAQWPSKGRALLQELSLSSSQLYQETLLKGERLFEAGLYGEAAPSFKKILEASLIGIFPESLRCDDNKAPLAAKIHYRLAQAYYLAEEYPKAIALLTDENLKPTFAYRCAELDALICNEIYLLGLSYKKNGQYGEAISSFKRYQKQAPKASLPQFDAATYEIALCQFKCQRFNDAEELLSHLDNLPIDKELRIKARLILVRIEMQRKKYEEANALLDSLAKKVSDSSPLKQELSFLKGEVAFELQNYSKAALYLEQSLALKKQTSSEWNSEALYHLGWSYLKMTEDPSLGKNSQTHLFGEAEKTFQQLLENTKLAPQEQERGQMALAQTYLRKGRLLHEEQAYEQAEELLATDNGTFSLESKAQALILRAEAIKSFEQRNLIYKELTSSRYSSTSFWKQGLYLRAINLLEQSEQTADAKDAAALAKEAGLLFEKTAELFKESDPRKAALSLKYQADILAKEGTSDSLKNSLVLYLNLTTPPLINYIKEPAELYYRIGEAAFRLEVARPPRPVNCADGLINDRCAAAGRDGLATSPDQNGLATLGGMQALEHVLTDYPHSKFAPEALFLLGTFQFQQTRYAEAKKSFLSLVDQYKDSAHAGDSLFWAAEAANRLSEGEEAVRALRQRVYTDYPLSAYAAEAYFGCYSYSDYLKHQPQAIAHLEKMKELFPQSPFLGNALFLLGLDLRQEKSSSEGEGRKKDLMASIQDFEASVQLLDTCFEQGTIPLEQQNYFLSVRYRSLLEAALTNLQVAEETTGAKRQIYLGYGEALFDRIIEELEHPHTPMMTTFSQSKSGDSLLEEALFGLAQIHIKAGRDLAAEQLLDVLLERHAAKSTDRNYLLSRVWFELGRMAMRRQDYELALQAFDHAERTGKRPILSSEQRLELWIQQSFCYRALGRYEEAMTALSKVINDDAISATRVRAMYLRAEIYQEQERPELAIRQLEATAKKGGEWAEKAKAKLASDYGYQ